jgi:uncharacterized protein
MATSGLGADAFFRVAARIVTERPWRVLLAAVVVLLGFAAMIPGLGVSTSRTGLVDDDDPQQQRMNAFFDRFGRPDAPVFLVSGGTPEQRRAVVDRLEEGLVSDPELELHGRVLGRIQPADVASVLLLQQPAGLAKVRAGLPPGTSLVPLLESGLVGWLSTLAENIEAGLDGARDSEVGAAAGDPTDALGALEQLALLAALLEDRIAGRDSFDRLEGQDVLGREGIDERGYTTTADGSAHIVTVFWDVDSDEGRVLEPLVERLRHIRDRALEAAPSEVRADLTGLPALSVDELLVVRRGLMTSSVVTTVGIGLLCLVLFRSVRQTVVALLPWLRAS